MNFFNRIGQIGLGVALVGGVVNSALYNVDGGHRAVIFDRFTGVRSQVMSEGMHFFIPWVQWPVIFDIRSRPKNIPVIIGSKDLQNVNITLRIMFRPVPDQLPKIFNILGQDYEERVLPSITTEVLKAVVGQFDANELINQQDWVSQKVSDFLKEHWSQFGVILDDISITHLTFSKELTQAVELKQSMDEKAKTESYANQLKEILSQIASGLWTTVCDVVGWFNFQRKKSVVGEIVLITGAGSGIGRCLALEYANAGATVVAVDINQNSIEKLVQDLSQSKKPKAHAYVCDVSDREQVLAMAKLVEKEVGDVTILINNAGLLYANPMWDTKGEHVTKTFGVNVLSSFWTIEAFLPTMRKRNKGHIVALCSAAAFGGLKNLGLYCSSKYAVHGLMDSLKVDLRTEKNNQIKTTCVYPFLAKTALYTTPSIRFENWLPVLDSEYVAKCVISAQRREITDVSIPSYWYYGDKLYKLLPLSLQGRIIDFLDITVLPED